MKISITVGVVIAVLALVAGFVPIIEVPYTKTVQYQDTETYSAIEPLSYEVVGFCKKEQRPGSSFVRSSVAFSKDLDLIRKALTESNKQVPVGYVIVQNKDIIHGIFGVHITFYSQGKEFTHEETLKLSPDELETVKYYATWKTDMPFTIAINADRDEWSWEYKVTPDTKTVQKERTVTKERPETRYKKVPVFEYLLHY